MTTQSKTLSVGLRVPPDLAAWLKLQAAKNQRSVSNQAVWALSQFRQQTQGATA